MLLPGAAALLAAAEAAEAVARLRAVARWVRTGRPLTADRGGCCSPTRGRWPDALDVDAFSRDHARTRRRPARD